MASRQKWAMQMFVPEHCVWLRVVCAVMHFISLCVCVCVLVCLCCVACGALRLPLCTLTANHFEIHYPQTRAAGFVETVAQQQSLQFRNARLELD